MSKRRAFTLTEVMIAMFILSSTMFVLSQLQVRSMVNVFNGRELMDRVYLVKKYLYRMLLEPEKAKHSKRQFSEPEMKLVVGPQSIHKKSSLASYAKELQILNATGTWQRAGSNKTITIVSFLPRNQEDTQ